MDQNSPARALTGRRNLLRTAGMVTAAGTGIVAMSPSAAQAAGLTAVTAVTAVTAYSVKDYGAVGNGSTNDRTAIQNAMNAAGSTGGTVFFPPGDYVVNGPLVPKANTILQGPTPPAGARWPIPSPRPRSGWPPDSPATA